MPDSHTWGMQKKKHLKSWIVAAGESEGASEACNAISVKKTQNSHGKFHWDVQTENQRGGLFLWLMIHMQSACFLKGTMSEESRTSTILQYYRLFKSHAWETPISITVLDSGFNNAVIDHLLKHLATNGLLRPHRPPLRCIGKSLGPPPSRPWVLCTHSYLTTQYILIKKMPGDFLKPTSLLLNSTWPHVCRVPAS